MKLGGQNVSLQSTKSTAQGVGNKGGSRGTLFREGFELGWGRLEDEPSPVEMKYTALSILHSQSLQLAQQYEGLFTVVASAYLALFQQKYDYLGLRNFYHLVKLIIKSIALLKHLSIEDIAMQCKVAIYRNFGGKEGLHNLFGAV